jgi:VanZ family protein
LRTLAFWRTPDFLYYWLPPILWGLAILVMSGDVASAKNTFGLLQWLLSWFAPLSKAQLYQVNLYVRKTGHVLAYGLMYFLWFRALRGHLGVDPIRGFLYALGLCLLVSMTDEGHQSLTRTRGGNIYDVLLDLSGSGVAALITFAVWSPRCRAIPAAPINEGRNIGPK